MPEPFESLGETLLRAGVAPAHVGRYLRELSEHAADLAEEEMEAGRAPDEAMAAARERLGTDAALAEAMLAEPALRSWTGRAPFATLVVGPVLLLILAWLLAVLGIVLLIGNHAPARPTWLPPPWLPLQSVSRIGAALLDLVQFAAPLMIAAWAALLGARQRSRPIWPLLGCSAVALIGASFVWVARWPALDPHDPLHRISFGFGLGLRGAPLHKGAPFDLAIWSQGLPLVAISLATAVAVYCIARGWRPETA
jgi:hypothetical protein